MPFELNEESLQVWLQHNPLTSLVKWNTQRLGYPFLVKWNDAIQETQAQLESAFERYSFAKLQNQDCHITYQRECDQANNQLVNTLIQLTLEGHTP